MTSTITNRGEAHDPLDPRVAGELQLLREQLIERLERRISRRRSLRREAGIEAAIAIIGYDGLRSQTGPTTARSAGSKAARATDHLAEKVSAVGHHDVAATA